MRGCSASESCTIFDSWHGIQGSLVASRTRSDPYRHGRGSMQVLWLRDNVLGQEDSMMRRGHGSLWIDKNMAYKPFYDIQKTQRSGSLIIDISRACHQICSTRLSMTVTPPLHTGWRYKDYDGCAV